MLQVKPVSHLHILGSGHHNSSQTSLLNGRHWGDNRVLMVGAEVWSNKEKRKCELTADVCVSKVRLCWLTRANHKSQVVPGRGKLSQTRKKQPLGVMR